MFINRIELKRRAKGLIRQGNPSGMMIALVFVLATTWVATVADLIVANPINEFINLANEWTLNLSVPDPNAMTSGTLDVMMQQLLGCFRGREAMIGLLVGMIIMLYGAVVEFGLKSHSMEKLRGNETGYGELFSWFGMAGKIILLQVLKLVFIYLWGMLFLFPALIAMYRYRLADYILIDHPEISPLEAIRRSKKLMRGHKMDLFTVDLSFFGWLFLQSFVLQLALSFAYPMTESTVVLNAVALIVSTAFSMFLVPYQQYTYAGYYELMLGFEKMPPVHPGMGQPPFVNPPTQDGESHVDTSRAPWDLPEDHASKDDSGDQGWNQ